MNNVNTAIAYLSYFYGQTSLDHVAQLFNDVVIVCWIYVVNCDRPIRPRLTNFAT